VGYRHLFEPIPGTKGADAWRYWLLPSRSGRCGGTHDRRLRLRPFPL